MKKILIIGSAPCHVGGVAVHIKRLTEYLSDSFAFDIVDESKDVSEEYFNVRSFDLYGYLKRIVSSDIIHIQSGVPLIRLIHVFVSKLFFKKVIVTIHHDPNVEGYTGQLINRVVFPLCQSVIFVNKEGYTSFNGSTHKNYFMMPAFLPQDIRTEQKLPDTILDWVEKNKLEGRPLLVSNAWKLVVSDWVDLYGLDMCIRAVKKAKMDSKPLSLIFILVSTGNNNDLYLKYCEYIKENHLDDYILIYVGAISFVRLILLSDLVVRPTSTDGDALSIREALYVGKSVLASDVVQRPRGTFLFKSRDEEDFYINIRKALLASPSENVGTKVELNRILDFYRKIYK